MTKILKAIFIAIAVVAIAVLVSLFLRVGDRSDRQVAVDIVALPVPSWCVDEMKDFSSRYLQSGRSGLLPVEPAFARYLHVGAVLVIHPRDEAIGIVQRAHEEHYRHCAIREEQRFFGPAALDQAILSITAGPDGQPGHFVVKIDPLGDAVHVIELPESDR
jgi:hypothetical protein